jgi:hypothetical protein
MFYIYLKVNTFPKVVEWQQMIIVPSSQLNMHSYIAFWQPTRPLLSHNFLQQRKKMNYELYRKRSFKKGVRMRARFVTHPAQNTG